MNPFSLPDRYGYYSSKQSNFDLNTNSSNIWSTGNRPKSPFGIDGLSPQSDDVVKSEHKTHQSPIGSVDTSSYGNSPPAHIVNIFSPSERSEGFLKALTLSPNATSSEPDFTDEEDQFNLPPPSSGNFSQYDDFLMGMGGMEDVGDPQPQYQVPRRFPTYDSNLSNGVQFGQVPRTTPMSHNPNLSSSSQWGSQNLFSSPNSSPRNRPMFGSFDSKPSPFESPLSRSPMYSMTSDYTPNVSNRPLSASYDSAGSLFQPSDYQPRVGSPTSSTRNPNTQKSSLAYRSVGYHPESNHGGNQPHNHPQSESPPSNYSQWNEHPFGEHPSRTLFVRNINSSVEESELKVLFEEYGPIRSMYTLSKHRGFVMISYFDIRHAKAAMRGLQNKILRRRKLDIHYSIPKDNPSEKDQNQGTLVVFNLDPSITKEELMEIFGVHGEIKEIRETPNKRHHKFIEFYDVRCAEAAIKALNKTEIKSKKIKIEPSRPGGRKNNAAVAMNSSTNSDDSNYPHVGSPTFSQGSWNNHSNHRSLRSISLPPGGGDIRDGNDSRSRRQDDRRQFTLNIDVVQQGLDTRTTLMIKNIPNKYTQKMLLSTVDEAFKGQYDFFYLPIDFKNKCNVGYAFINFIDPMSIVEFYQQLHNTKWEKFNSEKVCSIAYARIQGKESLIAHFQNSSLMSEDKKCRPIIFHSAGPKMGQQAPFPVGLNARIRTTKEEKKVNETRRVPRVRSYSCK